MTERMSEAWADGDGVLRGEARWATSCADFRNVLRFLPDKSADFVCVDPPYSKHVHASVRSANRTEAPDVKDFECRTRRVVDLGFDYLRAEVRRAAAREFARIARRWVAVFCDVESVWLWRISLEASGLRYMRTAFWIREGGAPTFSGHCPASGAEAIVLAHTKARAYWNGGGKAGLYAYPIVANRLGQRGSRVHPTQKPEGLMIDLVNDFSDAGEIVVDGFMGSGTTGVAALIRGRRFIGCEEDAAHHATAVSRLSDALARVELGGSLEALMAQRRGQQAMFR